MNKTAIETLPVIDFANANVVLCSIISSEAIEGYGTLYLVNHPEVGPLAVIQAGGMQFTPSDWQGEQPASVEDAAVAQWVDVVGNDAAMINGLPYVSLFVDSTC